MAITPNKNLRWMNSLLLTGILCVPVFAQSATQETSWPGSLTDITGTLQKRPPYPVSPIFAKAIDVEPEGYSHYTFEINAQLCPETQPCLRGANENVKITGSFDAKMQPAAGEKGIMRNFKYLIELLSPAGGDTVYTISPVESKIQFFPSDSGREYSATRFSSNLTRIFTRSQARIDATAKDTILKPSLRGSRNANVAVQLDLFCVGPDLCFLGTQYSGISYDRNGNGRIDVIYPNFRLVSEGSFRINPSNSTRKD